ncbi:MAG: triple tyrosine motif-containing protein, partial [Saprospiraceae bacterium]
ETRDGTIWIGADDRLTAFHPGVEILDRAGPNIQLTGLALFNETIPWQEFIPNQKGNDRRSVLKDTSIVLGNGVRFHDFHFDRVSKWYGLPEHLSLAHNNNNLTFQYVGINIQSPKKVKYQYKLEGLDQNWSEVTHRSEVTYSILPPYKYTFKVKAMNGEGYWSKELNYSFIIRPPWWSTWWFRMISVTMSIALIALILYVWLQFKFRQKLKVELIRQKLDADLHDEIGSTLSSMAFSAELAKKKLNGTRQDIEVLLNNLVSNSRETTSLINETIWSLNPKNESIDKWKEHIKDFAFEILSSKEINCQFDSNDQVPAAFLDLERRRNIYLIYKEAIHNIAKHSKASQVHIRIDSLQDKLSIGISDNGIGLIPQNHMWEMG